MKSIILTLALMLNLHMASANTIEKDLDIDVTTLTEDEHKEKLAEIFNAITDEQAGAYLKNMAELQGNNPELAAHKAELLAAADDPAQRTKAGKILRDIGIAIKGAGGVAVRGTSDLAIGVDLLISLPLRTVYKFLRGAITGNPNRPNGATAFEFMDGSFELTAGLGGYYLLRAAAAVAAGTAKATALIYPWLWFGPSVDYLATRHCRRLGRGDTVDQRKIKKLNDNLTRGQDPYGNPLTPIDIARTQEHIKHRQKVVAKSDRFCRNQQGMKDDVRSVTNLGQKGGAAIHNGIKKIFTKKQPPAPAPAPSNAPGDQGAGEGQ